MSGGGSASFLPRAGRFPGKETRCANLHGAIENLRRFLEVDGHHHGLRNGPAHRHLAVALQQHGGRIPQRRGRALPELARGDEVDGPVDRYPAAKEAAVVVHRFQGRVGHRKDVGRPRVDSRDGFDLRTGVEDGRVERRLEGWRHRRFQHLTLQVQHHKLVRLHQLQADPRGDHEQVRVRNPRAHVAEPLHQPLTAQNPGGRDDILVELLNSVRHASSFDLVPDLSACTLSGVTGSPRHTSLPQGPTSSPRRSPTGTESFHATACVRRRSDQPKA